MIEIYSARRSTSTSDKNLKFLMAALSDFLGRAACFILQFQFKIHIII